MTFPEMLKIAAFTKGDKPALRVERPVPELGADGSAKPSDHHELWKTWTYREYYEDANRVAKGIIKLGHEHHDSVAIFGFNSPEWFLAEIGAMMAGGKAAGVYPSDTPDQLNFKVKHSDASVAICEGKAELEKFKGVIDDIPYLKAIVLWAYDKGQGVIKRKDGTKVRVVTFKQMMEKSDKSSDHALNKRTHKMKASHCCTLVYTSGTTGDPKAVMLSHDNIVFEATSVLTHLPHIGREAEQERILSYLPLSHVAGMLVDIVFSIITTATRPGWVTTYFARPYDLKAGTLKSRLQCVRPTIFLGVPRVWEKIAEKIKAIGAKTKGAKKKVAMWAKAKGMAYQNRCQIGGTGVKPTGYAFAEKLVLSKVKDNLGLDKMKFGFSGAAPQTKDTLEFFGALGININEAYGMSESTGAVTWATDQCHQWGTIGFPLNGVEVKVFRVDPTNINSKKECPRCTDIFAAKDAEQGEICFRGRNVMMGYLANPKFGEEHVATMQKKNSEAVDKDGWLHSGDMGTMSSRGMLKITGRYKELIIGAGGENIAPVPIEDSIKKHCGAISNVMMIGDKRKFNICVITLKAVGATGEMPGGNKLDGDAKRLVTGIKTIKDAIMSKEYTKLVEEAIITTNSDGKVCPSNASKVQKFTILPIDFSVTTDELTATLKLKRGVVEKKYTEMIEKMYLAKDTYVEYTGPFPN